MSETSKRRARSEGQGKGRGRGRGCARGAGVGRVSCPERPGEAGAVGDDSLPSARRGGCARSSHGERANLYDEVTQRIIAELEAGSFPWVQPWSASGCGGIGAGLPRNAVTGRHYSRINILILWGEVIARGYPSQSWLTFAQARDAGGCVRKGEKGVSVVYADRFTPEAEKARAEQTGDDARTIFFVKRFTLFNVAQCDGLRTGLATDPAPLPEREMVPLAEALIRASGADFRIGGARAFYAPAPDHIQVPPQPAFADQINYYRTALYELTHWTGHASRLERDQSGAFGSKPYAREELVAEMGSAFLCAALGIVPTVRHADYLANWLDLLRDDLSDDPAIRASGSPRGRAIFRAASAASKAADYLLALRDAAGDAVAPEQAPALAPGA